MRILAFTPFSSMFGGANRSFLMVLRAMKNKFGHEIKVIVPEKDVLCDALDENGIEWELFPGKKIRGVYGKSLGNYLRLLRLYGYACLDRKIAGEIVKSLDGPYDLVYLNDCDCVVGAMVAARLKVPYVWHFRSPIKPGVMLPRGVKKAYGNCTRIIAISNGMKELLEKSGFIPKENITMIHNGMPITQAPRAAAYEGGELHMLLCGRLTAEKGHADALGAMRCLKERKDGDIYLHVVGAALSEGSRQYEAELKETAASYGIADRVIFEGQIDDMPAFRSRMHVELMCAKCEPFGRVTVEGMRSGLVVIGSDTGGTPEIIADGETGLLYRQGDAGDLAEKIHAVYSDPALFRRLADAGYAFGMTHFTEEENVGRVHGVLTAAAGNKADA